MSNDERPKRGKAVISARQHSQIHVLSLKLKETLKEAWVLYH